MKAGFTISKAARAAGVGVETVRFYERQQLIEQPPKPVGAGVRVHSGDTVRRIRFIKEAQDLGFSLREAKELFGLRTDRSADCAEVRELASAKLADVRQKIQRLKEIDAALERLIAACPGCGDLAACSIMDALDAKPPEHPPGGRRPCRNPNDERISEMKTTTFTVEGLRCNACAETVKRLVEREPGVKAVSVSFADRQARILYEPEAVSEDQLAATIQKPGYRVVDRQ